MSYLDPYSGIWSENEAKHLLKRTTFGVSSDLIFEATSIGMTASIEKLFETSIIPEPPLKQYPEGDGYSEFDDPAALYGETWVNGIPFPETPNLSDQIKYWMLINRKNSLYSWSFLLMQNESFSITEKLTLFWNNHFVAFSGPTSPNANIEYDYISIIRANALGNFRELTKLITVNVNMLNYLNGSLNTNVAPNENYSRELLELFTIGKGPSLGNGDYTNYTEYDVVEMAKVFTGWKHEAFTSVDSLVSFFLDSSHTSGEKKLSHRFNDRVVLENGSDEYKDLIDIIFEQEECSRFIIRQLYIWFVNSEIDEDIESNVIDPLAKIVRDNDYEIAPALKVLFASEHFYSTTSCMIKSPIDLMFSVTKSLLLKPPTTSLEEEYNFALFLYNACSNLEQTLFGPLTVAGWPAYYQEPLFYRYWINSYSLPKRFDFCKSFITGDVVLIGDEILQVPAIVSVIDIAASISGAADPNILIDSLVKLMFCYDITDDQKNNLKEFLLVGLPDFEWTVEYSSYLDNPSDEAIKASVEAKLRSLLTALVQMPEFQLM